MRQAYKLKELGSNPSGSMQQARGRTYRERLDHPLGSPTVIESRAVPGSREFKSHPDAKIL